ncbi:MAG: hypothetical protein WBA67_07550 [Jannaschia sp.]
MTEFRGSLEKLADKLKEKLSEALDALAPQADAVPIPVRNEPRDPRR